VQHVEGGFRDGGDVRLAVGLGELAQRTTELGGRGVQRLRGGRRVVGDPRDPAREERAGDPGP